MGHRALRHAGLTAYYMSRQVVLVFAGEARLGGGRRGPRGGRDRGLVHGATGEPVGDGGRRWRREEEPRGVHEEGAHAVTGTPHEAPPVMTIPLIILAVASTIGWLLNPPFAGLDFIDKWLAPVFPAAIAPAFTVATSTKWVIGLVATAAAFIGLFMGLGLWRRTANQAGAGARRSCSTAGISTRAYRHTVSGPGRQPGQRRQLPGRRGRGGRHRQRGGPPHRAIGRQMRRSQTGYVRNYALGIGSGRPILLAYTATRAGSDRRDDRLPPARPHSCSCRPRRPW